LRDGDGLEPRVLLPRVR